MISITGILLIFIIFAIAYFFTESSKLKGKLPPGPKGLPFIGNVHQLGREMHLAFGKWSKEYGGIYSLKLASKQVVVVGDRKILKEMFLNESAFTGRWDMKCFDIFDNGISHGIVNTDGEHWEELRRFTLRQLRDFGFGKNSMESCIMDEVNESHEWFESQKGKPIVDIKKKFTLAVVNSLLRIMSGIRYKQDDPKLIKIMTALNASIDEMFVAGGILFFAPWTQYVFPKWTGLTKFRETLKIFNGLFSAAVEEHKETLDNNFSRDFIDVFLKQIKNTSDTKSAFYGQLGEDQLVAIISDMFGAGSDTTATTLSWAILYLATFSDIQKKLQKEIEHVTGQSRPCSLTDRPNMPYAEAVLAEIMRFSSIIPTGLAHRALVDKEFHGFFIPKDTLIFADLYYIHGNPEIWGDPEEFRPERFLSPDGKSFKKHEALLPFSIGRRQCIGESLARDTLFLFLTNTIQKFNLVFEAGKPKPDLQPVPGFALNTKPFEIILENRFT